MDIFADGLPLPNCPFCGTAYASAGKETIHKDEHEERVHVTCFSCARALVLSIMRTPTRVRSVGVMTDCNAHDYARFHEGHKVTLDDVLLVHEGLSR